MKLRTVTGVTVFVTLGYIAYHGTRSFLRNEITVNITEVVHLPPSERALELEGRTSLQGEIQCETYLMRSYRFFMRLSATMTSGFCAHPPATRPRNRVMQATETTGSFREKKQKEPPAIFVDHVSGMVDQWELVPSGKVCFTPACIGDELLLGYEGCVQSGYCVSATIRNCYLQADETPGLKRLSFELVVYDVIHGAKVRIALSNRYCDIVAIHTGGVGSIQQPNAQKQHHIVWDIGTVDEMTWMKVKSPADGVMPEGRLARRGFTDDDLASALENSEGTGTVLNSTYSPGVTGGRGEKGEADDYGDASEGVLGRCRGSGLPEGTQLLVVNFILLFEDPDGLEGDYISSDSDLGEGEEDLGEEDEAKRRRGARRASGLGSTVSRKAAKREERARKKAAKQLNYNSSVSEGRGVSTRIPSIEFTYSVVGLASGVTVRKLQTVSERPNWIPCSLVDRWFLRWMVPCIHELRLEKFANYTTWFLQPVLVASL